LNELAGCPPRAAHATRNWLLASNKVSGRTVRLPLISVFGAVMVRLPEALIVLSGVRRDRQKIGGAVLGRV
jgi:hypothetical protein